MGPRPSAMFTFLAVFLGAAGIALAQAPTSVSLNPTTVQGDNGSAAQVTLGGPAPAGGLVVDLSSSNTAVATVPAAAVVPGGATAVDFPVTTRSVAQSTTVTITARAGGVSKTAQLTVAPPSLTSLTLTPAFVYGGAGGSADAQVRLSGRAPSEGLPVPISSSNPAVTHVKTGFFVYPGHGVGSLSVATSAVAQSTPVTITATDGVVTKTAVLAVLPAVPGWFDPNYPVLPFIGGQSRTRKLSLKGSAPPGGLLVSLSSSNTAAARVPANVTAPADATTVDIVVTAIPVAQTTTATITASAGGVSVTDDVRVNPPELSSVSFTPIAVVGGAGRTGQVSLNGPAPSGGLPVRLSAPAAVTVPASVTVPAEATTKVFEVTTIAVPSPVIVPITATAGSGTKAGSLTILPPAPTSLTLTPSSVHRGNGSTGQVTLNGPAPASGLEVQLSVSSPGVAGVPAAVIVPAGATTKTFPIQTNVLLPQSTTVTITASAGGVNVPAQLTVHP